MSGSTLIAETAGPRRAHASRRRDRAAAEPGMTRDHTGRSASSWNSHRHTIFKGGGSERFDSVAALLQQKRLRYVRRSQRTGEGIAGSVLLLDTIGELSALYALADVAFVGGSLVPRGGHNILEPARYGAAIVVGEHTENFRDIVELFRRQNAVKVTNPSNVEKDLFGLMADESGRLALGEQGAEVLQTQTGSTERTLSALAELLR